MLRKFNNSRTVKDNIQLGSLSAFSAGMVNVTSVIIFFAFTSNVTGHYAIFAEEVAKGNWNGAIIVFAWIFLFFIGNFCSNQVIINFNHKNSYIAHSVPLFLEIICLFAVGTYGEFYYQETLWETEIMVGLMLFAMGLQNGLTASISNFSVKTTHMTGLTTDVGILASMYTKKKYRNNKALKEKGKILLSIALAYITGGIFAGVVYLKIQFMVFYVACFAISIIIGYEYYKLKINKLMRSRRKRALPPKYKIAD
ncbi:putative membrane protein [Galbibacter orientalis DSM 19592]|uniref:Putative membrane protein n=1 Tax=Galbibacter orientalis DSM 19592 TaxID=926559 RepID=I3CAH2_9FLAO|nr:YoaK family protein [Galbibacter orientalis]EIJ40615.1 putative membrane protein [Galbibacter orientalis DSM 19592]